MLTTVFFVTPRTWKFFLFQFCSSLHVFQQKFTYRWNKGACFHRHGINIHSWLPVLSSKDPQHMIKCVTLLLPKCEHHPSDQWQEEASWLASRAGQWSSFHILTQLWCPWVNAKVDWWCLPERTGKLSPAQRVQNTLLRKVLRQAGIAWKGGDWQVMAVHV